MSNQLYILPRYKETPGVTDLHEKMLNSALEDEHTDNASPPSQEHLTQASSPPRYTWKDFRKSFFSLENVPYASLNLQFIAIAVGAFFLPDDFHSHPNPFTIWWLSLCGNYIGLGVWSSLEQQILKVRDDWVIVTDKVKADRIFHRAVNSVVPWLYSAVYLGIFMLLFEF